MQSWLTVWRRLSHQRSVHTALTGVTGAVDHLTSNRLIRKT
jgi:hypothetical protein